MSNTNRSFWLTPNGLAAIALIGAVLYFLLMEHRAHFIYALPFLILLLCPLMHMFMHHGHGGHGGHGGDGADGNHAAHDHDHAEQQNWKD